MRILFMYNERDPPHGSVKLGKLPDPAASFRPYRPMLLTQRPSAQYRHQDHVRILELRNEDVELPGADDTLIWCKMFKLDDMKHKHHLIRVSNLPACLAYVVQFIACFPLCHSFAISITPKSCWAICSSTLMLCHNSPSAAELFPDNFTCFLFLLLFCCYLIMCWTLADHQYEPIYDSPSSVHYLQHITLRECHGMHQELEKMAREQGRQCMGARDIPLACNAIVASWSRGSNVSMRLCLHRRYYPQKEKIIHWEIFDFMEFTYSSVPLPSPSATQLPLMRNVLLSMRNYFLSQGPLMGLVGGIAFLFC